MWQALPGLGRRRRGEALGAALGGRQARRHLGPAYVARHVIQGIVNLRFLIKLHPMTWRQISAWHIAHHVIDTFC